jgi:dephospho-CoA kinase
VIGLTGNIATGKSLVGQTLSRLGAEHIDADLLAHRAMAPGTPGWDEIVAAFGPQIVRPDGDIDRVKLGAIVFADPAALARLEAIVHPQVIAHTQRRITSSTARVVVVEAIKLIESGMVHQLVDSLWVVTAPREVQLARLMAYRGLSRAEATLRIDAQPPQATKVAQADVVIDNGGPVEATVRQVEQAWQDIQVRVLKSIRGFAQAPAVGAGLEDKG